MSMKIPKPTTFKAAKPLTEEQAAAAKKMLPPKYSTQPRTGPAPKWIDGIQGLH